MLTHFFVTGTDARVGKTIVTRALLQALAAQDRCVLGYKPIATGSQELADGVRNKDAVTLQQSSSISYPFNKITPLALADEDIYASQVPENVFEIMTNGLNFMRKEADSVVVEGCDGWRTFDHTASFIFGLGPPAKYAGSISGRYSGRLCQPCVINRAGDYCGWFTTAWLGGEPH